MKKPKISTIKVTLPENVKTFDEETEYLLREFGLGRIDHDEDAPPIEDCDEVFVFETERSDPAE